MRNIGGFIDIHAHILPGIDDGPKNMDETIAMLKIAYEQNIRTIIATPHYACGTSNASIEQLNEVRDKVEAEANKIDKNMKILLGNELYYSRSVVDALKSNKALSLAGSRYVLVEFSIREIFDSLYKGLREIICAGYLPILAHVERYQCLYKKEKLINELLELGCYIQMNNQSILGGILNREAFDNKKLIERGFVHFLGSDCHDVKLRPPCMKAAETNLLRECDYGIVYKILHENPSHILANNYI